MSSAASTTPTLTGTAPSSQTPLLGTPQIASPTQSPTTTGTATAAPTATEAPTASSRPATSSPSPSPSSSRSPALPQPTATPSSALVPTPSPSATSTSPAAASQPATPQTPAQTTTLQVVVTVTRTQTQTVTLQPSTTSTTATMAIAQTSSCPEFLCPPLQPNTQPTCIDLSRAPPFRALSATPLFLPTDLSPWTQARFPPGTPTSDTLIRASQSIRSPADLQSLLNLIVSDWGAFNLHLTGGCSTLPNHRHSLTFLVLDLATYFQAHPCNSALGAGKLPDLRLCASARDQRLAAIQSDLATASSNFTACSPTALISLQQLAPPLLSTDSSTCQSPDTLGLDSRVLCGYASSTTAVANKCDATLGGDAATGSQASKGGWTPSLITGVSFALILLALLFCTCTKFAFRAAMRWRKDRAMFGPTSRSQYMRPGSAGGRESPVVLVKPKLPNAAHAYAALPPPPRPPRPSSDVGVVYQAVAVRPSVSSLSSTSSTSSLQGTFVAPSPTMTPAAPPTLAPPGWSAPGSWQGPTPASPAAAPVHAPAPARPVVSVPINRSSIVGVSAARAPGPAVLHKVSSVPAIGSPLRMESTELLRDVAGDIE